MVTKTGKEVEIIDVDEPSEYDDLTGKRKPKKKKIINDEGEEEIVEEIEDNEPTKYDKKTGKKLPKKKKYKNKEGEIIELEEKEPS